MKYFQLVDKYMLLWKRNWFATLIQLTFQKICAITTHICKKVHSKQMKMLGNAAMGKGF